MIGRAISFKWGYIILHFTWGVELTTQLEEHKKRKISFVHVQHFVSGAITFYDRGMVMNIKAGN